MSLTPPITIAEAIQTGIQYLKSTSDTPKLDSEILLLHVLNSRSNLSNSSPKTRTWLLTWPDTPLTEEHYLMYLQSLNDRAREMPIAYITHQQGFWSFDLKVTRDTLIPRPETELLVECSLEKLGKKNNSSVLELGTGTGAIALALAIERTESHILATDISTAALEIAHSNAKRLNINNVTFLHSHWFESIHSQLFDLIVSNPPYIPAGDPYLQQKTLQYEPQQALSAGIDGLDALRAIIHQSPKYLKNRGWLVFEHGYDQQTAVQDLLNKERFENINTLKDLNGQPRISKGQKQF
jgi:release factor glutamine methyltransferase